MQLEYRLTELSVCVVYGYRTMRIQRSHAQRTCRLPTENRRADRTCSADRAVGEDEKVQEETLQR